MAPPFDVGRQTNWMTVELVDDENTAQISARTTALVQNFQNILGEVIQSQPKPDEEDEDGSANLVRKFVNAQNAI
jgi:hypothetical protein